jgi:hypothetical protein
MLQRWLDFGPTSAICSRFDDGERVTPRERWKNDVKPPLAPHLQRQMV